MLEYFYLTNSFIKYVTKSFLIDLKELHEESYFFLNQYNIFIIIPILPRNWELIHWCWFCIYQSQVLVKNVGRN